MLTRASHSHQYCRRLGIIGTMNFLTLLLKICVRKAQADELPYNQNAAIVLSGIYIVFTWASFASAPTFSKPAIYAICTVGLQLGGIYLLLKFFNKSNRFVQTISALLGTSLIINVTFSIVLSTLPVDILLGFLLVWRVYIPAVIIRSAIEIPAIIGFFALCAIFIFSFLLTAVALPDFGSELAEIYQKFEQQMEQQQQAQQSKT